MLAKHNRGAALSAAPAQAAKPDRPRGVRHYLHGDVLEADPTKCYCDRCDQAVALDHLLPISAHPDGKDGERYLRDLARWSERSTELRRGYVRPENAANILAAGAVAAREAREVARSPFHRWLDGQRHRSDPVGDLAVDILRDGGFPITLATRRQLEDHLAIYGSHVIKALRQAWREFKGGERAEWTLAHALAAELRITPAEAQELVEVEPVELTGHSGDPAYGYEFDLTDHASPKLAAKLLRRRRSLKVQVGPWIYDGIRDSGFRR